jgi:hypothetical protein
MSHVHAQLHGGIASTVDVIDGRNVRIDTCWAAALRRVAMNQRLRAGARRRERPNCCAAEQRHELASL